MSAIQIAGYVVAAVLAASRLLNAAKPLWALLPTKLAALLPAIVASLPAIASQFGLVATPMDLVESLLVSAAFLLPGAVPKAPLPPSNV
jgi:hypothetical protein